MWLKGLVIRKEVLLPLSERQSYFRNWAREEKEGARTQETEIFPRLRLQAQQPRVFQNLERTGRAPLSV